MTHEEYKQQLTTWAGLTEKRLAALCDEYLPQQSELGQAARYSLLGGGKRVRAVLTLAACQLAGADAADALDYACALEMLHCYSLIHDDMPCMDNDDFRRGRPSCHKQFGEATALLAADALVTAAFEVLAHAKCSAESRIEAVQLLARGGGDRGMLYGQELDKHFETVRAGETELLNLHAHKTGALIIAAVELGCAAAGVSAGLAGAGLFSATGAGLTSSLGATGLTSAFASTLGASSASSISGMVYALACWLNRRCCSACFSSARRCSSCRRN